MGKKCWRILFEGRVQGVGFRFTARRIAQSCQIKGWVKNRPDGKVEAEVEGEEESLRKFLAGLKESFAGFIRNCLVDEILCEKEFRDFEIKF